MLSIAYSDSNSISLKNSLKLIGQGFNADDEENDDDVN